MRARAVLLCLAVLVAGCSSSSDDDPPDRTTTTTSSSTTTTTEATTTTTAFEGGTITPVTTESAAQRTALLTAVDVTHEPGFDRVTFTFQADGVPGTRVEYVPEAIADGSGDVVDVAGAAKLQVRMEPASTFDLSGDGEPTYTGPREVPGGPATAVTEVVRTGDFEAVLTWVIGLGAEAPFRVTAEGNRIVVEVAAP